MTEIRTCGCRLRSFQHPVVSRQMLSDCWLNLGVGKQVQKPSSSHQHLIAWMCEKWNAAFGKLFSVKLPQQQQRLFNALPVFRICGYTITCHRHDGITQRRLFLSNQHRHFTSNISNFQMFVAELFVQPQRSFRRWELPHHSSSRHPNDSVAMTATGVKCRK